MAPQRSAGHRTVPHTADLRIEGWAPTAARCVAEAVLALVESFAEIPADAPAVDREILIGGGDPAGRLADALDEVIYRMDTAGELPRTVRVREEGEGMRLILGMVDVDRVALVGAVPKAVSMHELRFTEEPGGWRCEVTLDV
ncbi:archease [Actinomadura sp.]|uniref:archease n=1 Tax=Actinomadura sp. TaxID=1989 RepID=UPI0037CA3D3D